MGKVHQNDNREFTAKDLREMADLSYRQLNVWEEKGILPPSRGSSATWRRFTAGEVFAILVCAEVRKKFGVPLDRLRWLRQTAMEDKISLFSYTLQLMKVIGTPVFLYSNLEDSFEINSDLEIGTLMQMGVFSTDYTDSLIFLKLNPIMNKLLGAKSESMKIPLNNEFRGFYLRGADSGPVLSPEEEHVLDLIKKGSFSRLEIRMNDGEVKHITAHEDIGVSELNNLNSILDNGRFQKIEIVQTDGRVTRIVRKLAFKPGKNGDS